MSIMISKIRDFFISLGGRTFAAPYLPNSMIWITLILMVTDAVMLLSNQPGTYWRDHSQAESSLPFLNGILAAGPLLFAGVCLLYFVVLGAALGLLNRSLALLFWMTASSIHLSDTLTRSLQIFTFRLPDQVAKYINWVQPPFVALILGILLVLTLLRPRKRAFNRAWAQWILLGLWVVGLAGMTIRTVSLHKSGWQPIKTEQSPGPRSMAALAYDTSRNKAVLFGGTSKWIGNDWLAEQDTWEWDGQQWMSWVGLDELASIIEFTLRSGRLTGAVNAVSPNPVRNSEFATASTRDLGQKPVATMPALIVRLTMGEMGEEFVLASRRMQPTKLLASGYQFRFPDLADALRHEKNCLNAGSAPEVSRKSSAF